MKTEELRKKIILDILDEITEQSYLVDSSNRIKDSILFFKKQLIENDYILHLRNLISILENNYWFEDGYLRLMLNKLKTIKI